jgi:site-specific recombinase XerD
MQTVHSELVIERADDRAFDEAQLAAVAFLARYNGRTLDAYRQDLRGLFDWAGIVGLDALTATRGHIELYRQHMEQRALAASTIDRRLSTVCGFYRFAHIDGHHRQPGPIRTPPKSPPERGSRSGPQ